MFGLSQCFSGIPLRYSLSVSSCFFFCLSSSSSSVSFFLLLLCFFLPDFFFCVFFFVGVFLSFFLSFSSSFYRSIFLLLFILSCFRVSFCFFFSSLSADSTQVDGHTRAVCAAVEVCPLDNATGCFCSSGRGVLWRPRVGLPLLLRSVLRRPLDWSLLLLESRYSACSVRQQVKQRQQCRAASLQAAAETMPESAVTSLAVHLALILLLFADRCLYALGRS